MKFYIGRGRAGRLVVCNQEPVKEDYRGGPYASSDDAFRELQRMTRRRQELRYLFDIVLLVALLAAMLIVPECMG